MIIRQHTAVASPQLSRSTVPVRPRTPRRLRGARGRTGTVDLESWGDASGTAVFTWKQDSGAANPGVLTSTTPIDLSNGVQVYFPVGTYTVGDVFIIQCKAQTVSGVPRYELWPRPI